MTVGLPRPLEVHVINLDRDADRWQETQAAFGDNPKFRLLRSPGVDATSLPRTAAAILSRAPNRKLGTLGCFMAHVRAWEAVAARRNGWILVIEDDVVPHRPNWVFRAAIPDDADLVWVNRRMDPGLAPEGGRAPVVSPARAMLPVKAALQPGRAAPGGDGYLLSALGARKLLAAVEADGMAHHVDWILLRYALSPEEVRAAAGDGWLATHPVLAPDTTALRWSVITGYCLSPALIREREGRSSSRRVADGLGTVHTETPEGLVSEFSALGARFRFLVADPADPIQRRHHVGRLHEAEELAAIQAHVPRRGVYVDIGANVGNHAAFLARKLAASRVVVFEPNPAAIEVLRANLRLNGVEGVVDTTHLGVGLGEAETTADLLPREHNLGAARLSPNARGVVRVTTGDAALDGIRPDFLKVDVAGAELAVLRGLSRTIGTCRPVLLLSVEDREVGAVADWVEANGYVVSHRFRRYPAGENLMLMPRERTASPAADENGP